MNTKNLADSSTPRPTASERICENHVSQMVSEHLTIAMQVLGAVSASHWKHVR